MGFLAQFRMKHKLKLDDYQWVNLREVLKAIMDVENHEFSALHTGDWVGEIRWILEELDCGNRKPNQSAADMIKFQKSRNEEKLNDTNYYSNKLKTIKEKIVNEALSKIQRELKYAQQVIENLSKE